MIKENVQAELKWVYRHISSDSNLYWTHRNESELIRNAAGKRTTRSKISDEIKEENKSWEKNNNAQFGYGEITQVSCRLFINLSKGRNDQTTKCLLKRRHVDNRERVRKKFSTRSRHL